MVDSKVAASWLFGVAALATLGFGVVTARVARGRTSRADRAAQRQVHALVTMPVTEAAEATAPFGKWYAHLPAALTAGWKLQRLGRTRGAVAVVASSVSAALLSRLLDRALKHRAPPPQRGEPAAQSYPSGHALETSAFAITSGYVMMREGLAPAWSAGPLALFSAAAGAGKLLLDRHWATDLVGGYCAGIALGAACAGVYELGKT